jgi:hypothetical protein
VQQESGARGDARQAQRELVAEAERHVVPAVETGPDRQVSQVRMLAGKK